MAVGLALFAVVAVLQFLHRRSADGGYPLKIEIFRHVSLRPAVENQAADETLQSLPLAVLELQELDTRATRPDTADDGRFNMDGMGFVGDFQFHAHDIPLNELGFSMK